MQRCMPGESAAKVQVSAMGTQNVHNFCMLVAWLARTFDVVCLGWYYPPTRCQ